ncbi:MAG: N-acetylmuramoyl-L-alanine amidase [Bacteroidales bacterium]|nr:N-acetylmuramoyl-L-alanine amidase [Bacteroidales bacterium]
MSGNFTWILDNGHGIDTPGKRSPRLPDGRQLFEYRFNREVVDYLELFLKSFDIPVHRLVPEEWDISLGERVRRANSLESTLPKILVSVHANAYGDGRDFTLPRGIETWYWYGSMSGEYLAHIFQANLVDCTGLPDRGNKPGRFYITRYAMMPAVITESGFYTNREELELMLDPDWRVRIAQAHFEAIQEVEALGERFLTNFSGRRA